MFSIQWTVKSDTSEKKVRGTRSCRNRAYKPYSVEQDEIITPKSSKHSVESAAVSFKTTDFMTLKKLIMYLM